MLDGAESPNFMNTDLRLTLQPNPIFTGIDDNSRSISVDDINDITITVSYKIYKTNNVLLNRE